MNVARAIEIGRALRLGRKSDEKIAEADAEALADHAIALVAAVDAGALEARDDVESILWFLGSTGHANAERRVLARAQEIDARILAARDEWDGAPAITPWLARIARVDAEPWWLDRVALATLRAQTNAGALFAKPSATRPLTIARPTRRELAEVVGQEDTLARGVVVARMFDGTVDVLVVDAPFGLHLRSAGKIDDAMLAGKRGFASASSWWLPIPDELAGSVTLVVTVDGANETLTIEF